VSNNIQELKELKQLFQNVFESDDGKKVLANLSNTCFESRTTFHEKLEVMAFREGQRSVILHIKNFMKIDLEKTQELMDKQNKENQDND
jgi:hypothetical protein